MESTIEDIKRSNELKGIWTLPSKISKVLTNTMKQKSYIKMNWIKNTQKL